MVGITMAELIIFVLFMALLFSAHFLSAVIYKAKTHSKKSLWWIMDNEV
jgi:hypothetical protein